MKALTTVLIAIVAVIITACSGSDTYRGNWKATDIDGAKFEINFDAKTFTVKDSVGDIKTYEYTQNSVTMKNNAETYGIVLEGGNGYRINFPNADNENVGIIKDQSGNFIYTICRTDFVEYKDIVKLQ